VTRVKIGLVRDLWKGVRRERFWGLQICASDAPGLKPKAAVRVWGLDERAASSFLGSAISSCSWIQCRSPVANAFWHRIAQTH